MPVKAAMDETHEVTLGTGLRARYTISGEDDETTAEIRMNREPTKAERDELLRRIDSDVIRRGFRHGKASAR